MALRKRQRVSATIQSATQRNELKFLQYENRLKVLLGSCKLSKSEFSNLGLRLTCVLTFYAILLLNLCRKGHHALKKTRYPALSITVLLVATLTSLILFPLVTLMFLTISFISAAYPAHLHHLENYLSHCLALTAQFFDDQISKTLDGLERQKCSILPVTRPGDNDNSLTSHAIGIDKMVLKTTSSRLSHCGTVDYTWELLASRQAQLPRIGRENIPSQSQQDPKVPLVYLAGRSALANEAGIRLKRPHIAHKFDEEGWLIISKPESYMIE